MKYVLFTFHGFLELFKKVGQKTLFDYAKKGKFKKFMENGNWGFIYFEKSFEKAYFNFLSPNIEFPGESFLRILGNKIEFSSDYVYFLGYLLFTDGSKILETDVKLSINEKNELIKELKKYLERLKFKLYSIKEDLILEVPILLSKEENLFPNLIKGKSLSKIYYKGTYMKEINKLMMDSHKILNAHPVNKVRGDFNEPLGNFLYLFGMGKSSNFFSLKNSIGKEIKFFSLTDKLNGLIAFYEIEKIERLEELKEGTIYWLSFFNDSKNSPIICLKNFEYFSQEILEFFEKDFESTKFLFIFDPFVDVNYYYENSKGIFLTVNFSKRIRKNYKFPNFLFKDFVDP